MSNETFNDINKLDGILNTANPEPQVNDGLVIQPTVQEPLVEDGLQTEQPAPNPQHVPDGLVTGSSTVETSVNAPTEASASMEAPQAVAVGNNNAPQMTTVTEVQPSTFAMPEIEAKVQDKKEAKEKDGSLVEAIGLLTAEVRTLHDAVVDSKRSDRSEIIAERLKNISINLSDLSSINIAPPDSNGVDAMVAMRQTSIIEEAYPKYSFPVICLKSGYRANMKALTTSDKVSLMTYAGAGSTSFEKIARLVYGKIESTSLKRKLSFNEFLNTTAEDDFETLLYGIYYATFPESTEYNITCPRCDGVNTLAISPDHLFEVIDHDRASKYVQEVLSNYDKGEEFLASSLLNKLERIYLPNARAVVTVGLGSLKEAIDKALRASKMRAEDAPLAMMQTYIKEYLVLNIEVLLETGENVFIEIKDSNAIQSYLDGLSQDDMTLLTEKIADVTSSHNIRYRIPDITCAHSGCGERITKINMDITSLLFFVIQKGLAV